MRSRNEPATVSVPEAGRMLGLGRCTAYRLARARKLPVLKLGRQLRVPIVAIEEMLRNPLAYSNPTESEVEK